MGKRRANSSLDWNVTVYAPRITPRLLTETFPSHSLLKQTARFALAVMFA
jgi:hypothetical protein